MAVSRRKSKEVPNRSLKSAFNLSNFRSISIGLSRRIMVFQGRDVVIVEDVFRNDEFVQLGREFI